MNRRVDRKIRQGMLLSPLLLLVFISGCAVGPDFQKPEVPVPKQWVGDTGTQTRLAEINLAQWWTVFGDPTLTSLVSRAIESNLDLRLAEARVRQARASKRGAWAELGPKVGLDASFKRSQMAGPSEQPARTAIYGQLENVYQTGFDASWELDIFGGGRRNVEAATADLEAAVESRRDTMVTMTAEVARNYLELRTYQQRIAIARQNLAAERRTADLTRKRFDAGLASGLDTANAEAQAATTAAAIPVLESSARQSIYALSVLIGREPGALMAELTPEADIPAGPPTVPAGLPSELLRRRPDIRKAEAQIHAATARIGVAEADLFPKLNLTATLGYEATLVSALFNPTSLIWSLGLAGTYAIVDSGRTRAQIEQQKALEEQTVIQYRQTVLGAFQDVEKALITSAKEQEHRQALAQAAAANRKAVDLSKKLYAEGQVDFLNVLSAQRSLYSSEDALVQSNGVSATNLVALYKALGGGWSEAAEKAKTEKGPGQEQK